MTRHVQRHSPQDKQFYSATLALSQSVENQAIGSIDEVYQAAVQKLERKELWFQTKQEKVAEIILVTSMPYFPSSIPNKMVQSVHRKLSLLMAVLHEENMAIRISHLEHARVLKGVEIHIFETIVKRLVRNSILLQKQNDSKDMFLMLKKPMVEVLDDIDYLRSEKLF